MARTNIVLVVLDSVRRDHVSSYGHDRETTPEIDRIAAEGIRYDRAYATSCWTIPSHASIFTGLFPSRHRTDFDTRHLDASRHTVAQSLGSVGYRTASFSCNGFVSSHTNLTQGFDVAVDVNGQKGSGTSVVDRAVRRARSALQRRTMKDRGARRATALAREWIGQGPTDRPFFLFLNYMECHLPYALKGPDRLRLVPERLRSTADGLLQDPFAHMAGQLSYTEDEVEALKGLYDSALLHMDGHVGALRAQLEAAGVWDDTLFVVTSDHGESFGEHGLFDHQYGLYEHLIRVPLVVKPPRSGARGATGSELVQLSDLPRTFQQAAGAEGPPFPGVSLLDEAGHDHVLAEYLVPNLRVIQRRFPDTDTSRLDRPLRCVGDGRFKLVTSRTGDELLFDLDADPDEVRDVAPDRPDVVQRLRAVMDERLGPWPDRSAEVGDGTDELQERLQALGYL